MTTRFRSLLQLVRRSIGRRIAPAPLALPALIAVLCTTGCSSMPSWMPTIPTPSFGWLWGSDSKKIGPLPESKAIVSPKIAWQVNVGKAAPGLSPAVAQDAVYAAASDGTIVRVNPATGQTVWRVSAGAKLSAGVGADATVLVVGTAKGDVLAFDPNGKPLWQAKVSSEVLSPPKVADGLVVVWSGDGRVFALSASEGKTKWVYQRNNPPLMVRNTAGGVVSRGGLFTGTAGGKLLALDLATGTVAWEGNVATPKGATELERIADITSLPLIEEQQACAVAFQGRIACFELVRGTLNWSRDVSSLEGVVVDANRLYVTDDRGAIQAMDKTTGSSTWKQDKLATRRPGGPQLIGDYVAVVDVEGYLHLLDRNDGNLVGRIATDGSPATAQPSSSGANIVWQSGNGTLYSASAR
jgi:outer membrane protein assembly factor BamB